MIEHVRNVLKIRLPVSGYYWKSGRIHESFYQCSLSRRCFCSVIWVTLMARVALRTIFGTAFPGAAEMGRVFGIFWGYFW